MKKKKKILSCFLALFVAVMTVLPGLSANAYGTTSNVTGYAPGGWKIHHTDGHIQTNPPGMIYMDADTGEWLFCVEPHINSVGGAHNSRTDLASYLGDANLAKRLSLIAYYSTHSGWGNDGWAVGQSMIWQLLTQRAGESGEQYVITPNIPDRTTLQNYYNAVNAKVDAYLSYPSFNGTSVTLEAGKSVTLTDTKGVLSSMRVDRSSGPVQIQQNGNQLIITATGTGAGTAAIRIKKPLENGIEGQNFVYTDGRLQDLMTCNYYDPLYATLNINVTPATTSMTFSKQDLTTGAELPGAKLQVTDEAGTVIDRWTSTDQPHQIEGLIVGKTYYMEETLPAAGYVTANRITFVADRNAAPVVMKDDVTRFEISKKDLTNGEELPGAHLQVTDEAGTVIDEWVSTDTPHYIEKLIVGKTYTLTETLPAEGYTTAESIRFTVADTGEVQHVSMEDDITRIQISKTDLTTGAELPGAHLQVTDEAGTLIDEWVSTDTPHYMEKLVVGKTYTLTETLPAEGYATAESIEFTVGDTGELQKIEMKDDIIRVQISKTDLTTGEELPGAHLQVTDETGTLIDEWVSTDTPHYMEKLVVGKTYTLTETLPAEGYATAESIEFTVEDTGEIQKIEMKDDITKVQISKTDLTTGEELPGAHLQVIDETGTVIDEWISEDTPHYMEKLVVGKTYTLTETLPAEGYATAESIEFTVGDTGEIQKIEMKDDTTKTEVSKRDTATKEQIPGAVLQIIDKDGKVVREWTSEKDPVLIDKLIAGETYTLHEKEAPKGYLTADDVKFTVADTGEIQTVAIEDELAVIKLEVGKKTIRRTQAGDTYKYTITNIKNASNTALENFTCTDSLPDLVIMKELHTGTFNFDLTYAVSYQINGSGEWHTLADGLSTTEDHVLSFAGIPLKNGEQVTGFRYEFGTVPEGFAIGSVEPVYFVTVKDSAKASEKLVNHIKLTGDWRGSTTEANDETVTLLFENSITAVLTGDALPGVYLFISMMVSALVLCAVIISRKRSRE